MQVLDKIDSSTSVRNFLKPLSFLLEREDITEICINEPHVAFVESYGKWQSYYIEDLTFDCLFNLGQAAAKYRDNVFDSLHPILSVTLPDGERCQFVMPPAVGEGKISLTIRKPAFAVRSIPTYKKAGFFKHLKEISETDDSSIELYELYKDLTRETLKIDLLEEKRIAFLKRAVELGKNIVIAGATGSGKTTFMKSLMQFIPKTERIITIEDVPELEYGLREHKNLVSLFYPSEATDGDLITAASLVRSCLRMKPDRILLAELRGPETFDFLNAALSGHSGTITSCHSSSCPNVFRYLALKAMQNPKAATLSYEQLGGLLKEALDVVVHIANDHLGRHITAIYYNPRLKAYGEGQGESHGQAHGVSQVQS